MVQTRPVTGTYGLVVYRPVWMPFNDVAKEITFSYINQFSFPLEGRNGEKYRMAVASFLYAAQRVILKEYPEADDGKPFRDIFLGVRRRDEAWSHYPHVGKKVGKKVVDSFLNNYCTYKILGSGDSGLYKDSNGKWRTDPLMSMYEVIPDLFDNRLTEARFIQTGLPYAVINKEESYGQRRQRQARRTRKPRLNKTEAKGKYKDHLRATERRVQALNEFWLNHPLVMPNGHAGASVSRIYHDGRMDAGGRLYGLWTASGEDDRLEATIDREPVCEIDICASQPTLLSCLLGIKLQGLQKDNTWNDVYAELSRLAYLNWEWTVVTDDIDPIDLIKFNRKIAKLVIMEMIGTGNVDKPTPSPSLVEETGLTDEGWKRFKKDLIKAVPALKQLEPRYGADGKVDGYINGAGFLSYHEAEIMMLTLEALKEEDLPAYPVHDCLIVRHLDLDRSVHVFRDIIYQYCKEMSGLEVLIPLSVDSPKGLKIDSYDINKLKGKYLS